MCSLSLRIKTNARTTQLSQGSYDRLLGLLYSVTTMPLETVKNRMAFQKPDPQTGKMIYTSIPQSLKLIASSEGVLSLW
jgi:hypothetical protein